MRFNSICQVRPTGNPHAACLDHVAAAFASAADLPLFQVQAGDIAGSVVIGAHLLKRAKLRGCAIWNTEQVTHDSPWLSYEYLQNLRSNEVWDYSTANVEAWKEHGVDATWVPLGYDRAMRSAALAEKNPTTGPRLFYGSSHPRREAFCTANGVYRLGVCYGAPLDRELARATVVYNIHYYSAAIFEQVRCSYLWANGVPVLSERSVDGEFWEGRMPPGTFHDYAELAAAPIPDGEAQRQYYEQLPLRGILGSVL